VAQEPCSVEHSSTKTENKGVVVIEKLFTSLKGIQVLLQTMTLVVNFMIFANTIVEEPVKEI
jgi:hypothetical protein